MKRSNETLAAMKGSNGTLAGGSEKGVVAARAPRVVHPLGLRLHRLHEEPDGGPQRGPARPQPQDAHLCPCAQNPADK